MVIVLGLKRIWVYALAVRLELVFHLYDVVAFTYAAFNSTTRDLSPY